MWIGIPLAAAAVITREKSGTVAHAGQETDSKMSSSRYKENQVYLVKGLVHWFQKRGGVGNRSCETKLKQDAPFKTVLQFLIFLVAGGGGSVCSNPPQGSKFPCDQISHPFHFHIISVGFS